MKSLQVILVLSVFLSSCSNNCEECVECVECEDCTELLNMHTQNVHLPVDLPENKPFYGEQSGKAISLVITEDERFLIKEKEYKYDELEGVLKEMSFELKTRKVKIKADPSVQYKVIFKNLAKMKNTEFNPILGVLEKDS